MTQMVERIARAMANRDFEDRNDGPWEKMPERMHRWYRAMAKAALKELLDPTEDMIEAGWEEMPNYDPTTADVRDVIIAAIKAALEDQHD